jgi:ribosomal peptide maturation radical SAM protein 1
MRIALVNMPFASAARPSLALGLLQSLADRRGDHCCSKYFNTLFARMLGSDAYRKMADYFPVPLLAGEWVFSQAFYGRHISSWDRYESDILSHPLLKLPPESRALIQSASGLAEDFLQLCVESCDWSQYQIVGFTSTFEQTMASMCLARLVKRLHPTVTIVMGGANFESGMARPYLDLFPFVDYICHGEADVSFLELCEALENGEQSNPDPPPPPRGFIAKGHDQIAPAPKVQDLDSLPYPNFDDFFRTVRNSGIDPAIIPMEAARGCWWGEKSHCTFCGLNGETMRFRQKSPDRVVAETAHLSARYQPRLLSFSDNILSRDYMKTVLPQWAADSEVSQTRKFFEVKANMRRDEVVLLKQAGIVQIQPGIESLVDSTLRIMGKGVTGAQNIALLRWCMEIGIEAHWNLLYGFPGEDPDSFALTTDLVQKLSHLSPPQGCFPIRVDRFSPNYERWQQHGFQSVTPLRAYSHVFDAGEAEIAQLAYFFDYEHSHTAVLPELAAPMRAFWELWLRRHSAGEGGEFSVVEAGPDGCTVSDTRFNRPAARWQLTSTETALLLACDQPTSRRRLPPDQADVLESLLLREIVVECCGKLIAAPLIPQAMRDQLQFSAYPRPAGESHSFVQLG